MFKLKIFFLKATWLSRLKFGTLYYIVVLHQVCSNGSPKGEKDPVTRGLGSKMKCTKISSSITERFSCLALPCHPKPSFIKRSQGSKMALPKSSRVCTTEYIYGNIKTIFFLRTTWLRCMKFDMHA